MTRWIILVGALLLGVAIAALAVLSPAALQGFSGLVIWMFLGYCAIIVVAQVCGALRALGALLKRPAATPTEPARVREGGRR